MKRVVSVFAILSGPGFRTVDDFHLFESRVKELHAILGLAFVAAVLMHVVYNWAV
ncbi:DUF4405 domain-containing protein [bacterium]|nr:DUF4405 domain-containing protein [bacterium]